MPSSRRFWKCSRNKNSFSGNKKALNRVFFVLLKFFKNGTITLLLFFYMQEREGISQVETMKIADLPALKPDYVRLVHITHPSVVDRIKQTGLNYENYGMVSSTARYWQEETLCEYWSKDPRFSFPGAVAIVMDVPMDEIRLHDNVRESPGVVPAEYIVGVVEARNPNPYT